MAVGRISNNRLSIAHLPYHSSRFVSINLRHVHVHHNSCKVFAAPLLHSLSDFLNGFLSVFGLVDCVIRYFGEDLLQSEPYYFIVVHH